MHAKSRLVLLTGPSGMGKSPLTRALHQCHPELAAKLLPLVLYNSRSPRPGEHDGVAYYFRSRGEIEALRNNARFLVIEARSDLQAVDLDDLRSALSAHDVLFEGNPFVARSLQTHPALKDFARLSIFLAPLSREEIVHLQAQPHLDLPGLITDIMRRKLLRRTRSQKGELSLQDLEEIERRAGSAYSELQLAHHFDSVIPNHDGEDSDNWQAFHHPIGDARRALLTFVDLLQGGSPSQAERWNATLLG